MTASSQQYPPQCRYDRTTGGWERHGRCDQYDNPAIQPTAAVAAHSLWQCTAAKSYSITAQTHSWIQTQHNTCYYRSFPILIPVLIHRMDWNCVRDWQRCPVVSSVHQTPARRSTSSAQRRRQPAVDVTFCMPPAEPRSTASKRCAGQTAPDSPEKHGNTTTDTEFNKTGQTWLLLALGLITELSIFQSSCSAACVN